MHILYVDESGSIDNASERYFVLGGIAVFERGIYHLIKAADDCVTAFGFEDPDSVELHASTMYSGRSTPWRSLRERHMREKAISAALSIFATSPSSTLFAAAVDKEAVAPADPIEIAFEEICSRFNLFLQRRSNRTGEGQRGLIVMDETKHAAPLQSMARRFRRTGGRWGRYPHLAEVPLFVDSRASRLVQIADLIAYATWRRYEFSDGRFFDPIIPKFDAEGGVIHGLVHRRRLRDECYCPACQSRVRR
ncbi:DUF3800 domain-containing protein [Alsobacter sp. KACC 23698]|uniref:DUF3800 domain-containing protein n=1 Tax=Alsobacter sp. KACC 23698 TaxID=3149229 RepID=A0AAU7JCY9_9HYPH